MDTKRLIRFAIIMLFAVFLAVPCAQNPLPVVNIFRTGFLNSGEPNYPGQFTVTKDQNIRLIVHLEFSGTATRNLDYTAVYPFSFPTNALLLDTTFASALININVRDDLRAETNETVTVTILPNPSYTVGPFGAATITLADNDNPNAPNIPPTASLSQLPPYINAGTNFNLYVNANDVDGDLATVELFDGTALLHHFTDFVAGSLNKFIWSNVPPGLHKLYVSATDNRGATITTTNAVVLAGDIITAATNGTLSGETVYNTSRNLYFDPIVNPNAVVLEFPIPNSATNRGAFLSLSFTASEYPADAPIDLYLYTGDGKLTLDDFRAPLTYVTSIQTNAANQPLQIDLSPWIGAYAEKILGVQLRIDPTSEHSGPSYGPVYTFSAPILTLLGFDDYYLPPHIQFPTIPASGILSFSNSIPFDIIISDAHDTSTKWSVAIDGKPAAQGQIPASGPATNRIDLAWPDSPLGAHSISVQLANATNLTTAFEKRWLFGIEPGGPPLRPFGASGQSKSFYVIDRAGRAQVWGAINNTGALGIGYRVPPGAFIPQPITLSPPPGRKWRQIAAELSYAIGLADDYSLWGWGTQSYGQFGFQTNLLNLSPIRLPQDLYPQSIAVTTLKAYVLDIFGGLWIMEAASTYSAGRGWQQISAAPQSRTFGILSGNIMDAAYTRPFPPPSGETWQYVSAGQYHALALTSSGQMYAWGQIFALGQNDGRLPFPGVTSVPAKASIPGVQAWAKVAAGSMVSLAVDDHGKLYAWGPGNNGSRAPIPNLPTLVDVPADVTGWLDIAVTDTLSMALANDGRLFAWGQNVPVSPFPELVANIPNLLDPFETKTAIAFYGLNFPDLNLSATIKVAAPLGTAYSLETSADLQTWAPSGAFTNTGAIQTISLPNAPANAAFYRLAP